MGAIVRNGPTNEFGILAIAPSSGKMIFWENVDSAEARSHFAPRQQGVEGSIKMYSGEVVTDLVDIEHAGYVVVLSSGRVAQLTLRDSQGRPNIATNVLNAPSSSSGSFFSFKGLLGNAFRKSIASVKARQSDSKGQMEVITATKNGIFQIWDLRWDRQHNFKSEIDVYAEVLAAIHGGSAPESRGQHEAHILDFAILDHQKAEDTVRLLVLVALSGREAMEYSLLEVDLSNNAGAVSRAIPLRNIQQSQLPKEPTGVLLLPSPGHTAFVQFPGALAVVSLAEPEESPDAQLLSDSGKPSLPFQDAVYFRTDRNLKFCGAVLETPVRKDKQSSATLFIQGFGAIQISAFASPDEDDSVERHRVTAKSKLEQATFFSINPDNILDFSIKSRYTFGQEEVENAAVEISTAILSSSYDHVEKVTSSMDEQIRKRATALRNLNAHLRAEYPPVSFATKWHLLWNAEKLAAAQALWNTYQTRILDQQKRLEAYPEPLHLPHMIKCLHEKYKTKIRPELGETDPVRQFFLKDINTLEVLLPWAWQVLRTFYLNNESKERPAVLQRLSEANDVILTAVETAFKFREDNFELYGLDPDSFHDGLLIPDQGQDMLPQFWTSTHNMVTSIRSLVDVGRIQAYESFDKGLQEGLAMKIAEDNPRLIKIGCQTHIERFTWALAQTDEKKREMGRSLREEWNKNVRPEHIYSLVEIGQVTEGMNLAEHYRDMTTLVRLIWDETRYMEESKENAQSKMEQAECIVKLNRIKERIHRYFDKYGTAWAEAFYSKYITENRSGQLFYKQYLNQPALTKFLRSDRTRGRLTWINEVCGEKNYDLAHNALIEVATNQETNAWCKKVELSIAKLALLCKKQEKTDANGEPKADSKVDSRLARTVEELDCVKIQERVYNRLAPIISGALDDESAVQLLMNEFGQGYLASRSAHQQLLQQGFENLIHNRVVEPALLIDVLTLMTYDESIEPTEITQNNEFAFALRVLVLSWNTMNRTTRTNLLRLIWKRLCIRDDWNEINNTRDVSDAQLEEFLAHTSLGWTFKALLKMIGKSTWANCITVRITTNNLTAEKPANKVASPPQLNELLGAGCTNGELCVRFASEDLRNPIIADNLSDDEILQTNIEKHRLDEWFVATLKAAKKYFEAEQRGQPINGVMPESDVSVSVEGIEDDEPEAGPISVVAGAVEGNNERDTEDVEMQDQ